jgi:hypothetical protein
MASPEFLNTGKIMDALKKQGITLPEEINLIEFTMKPFDVATITYHCFATTKVIDALFTAIKEVGEANKFRT